MSCYISEKLCHFVGRTLTSQDEQFQLLVSIVKDGRLLFNPQHPDEKFRICSSLLPKVSEYGEIFVQIHCVCFCDIPDDALKIHTLKYSKFGIGFSKRFIVDKGARPILYIPIDGVFQQVNGDSLFSSNPEQYYKAWHNQSISLLSLMMACVQNPIIIDNHMFLKPDELKILGEHFRSDIEKVMRKEKLTKEVYNTMSGIFLSMIYTKFFDSSLLPEDPNNFYYEREWRSISNISFNLCDICSIYLPSREYEFGFRNEFPEYSGDIIILND